MAGGSIGGTPELERLRARLDAQAAEDDDLGGRVAVAETAAATALTSAQAAAAVANQNQLDIIVYSGRIGRPAWSVDRFGAERGNQNVDTASAIEAAASAHGAFYLPQGDWYCETEASLPSNTKGHADGWDARLLWRDNAPLIGGLGSTESVRLLKGENTNAGSSDHLSGILIEGMHLDGNGDNQQTEVGALAAVTLHGDDHTVQGCKFTGFRPGESKEVFWVNISGTTGAPAMNPRVIGNVFSENAGQSLSGTTECSIVLVAGYPVDGPAGDIAVGGEVSGNTFRDLTENGTTHNRTVHAIALMGADGLVSHNRMHDCTGNSNFIHYNSGSVLRQTCLANHYDGTASAIALYRGLVGSYDPDYQGLSFIGNHFLSSTSVCPLVHYSTGSGVLRDVLFTGNHIESTGANAGALSLECRIIAQLGTFTAVNNTLIGNLNISAVDYETGFHTLLVSTDPSWPGGGAVPAVMADKLLIGENRTRTGTTPFDLARATSRAYLNSTATALTWTLNANWGGYDL